MLRRLRVTARDESFARGLTSINTGVSAEHLSSRTSPGLWANFGWACSELAVSSRLAVRLAAFVAGHGAGVPVITATAGETWQLIVRPVLLVMASESNWNLARLTSPTPTRLDERPVRGNVRDSPDRESAARVGVCLSQLP